MSLFVALSLGFCFRKCRGPTQHAVLEGLDVKVWSGLSLTRRHNLVVHTVPPVPILQDGSLWALFVAGSIAVCFLARTPFSSLLPALLNLFFLPKYENFQKNYAGLLFFLSSFKWFCVAHASDLYIRNKVNFVELEKIFSQ